MIENVVIIGSGPAAYVAGIYLATANLSPTIILTNDKSSINFNGLDKIAGLPNIDSCAEYLQLLRKQAERFNVKFIEEEVAEIYFGEQIQIVLQSQTIYSKTIIFDDLTSMNNLLNREMFDDNGIKMSTTQSNMTQLSGVFVCGSAAKTLNEAIFLSSSGCMTALDTKTFIESNY